MSANNIMSTVGVAHEVRLADTHFKSKSWSMNQSMWAAGLWAGLQHWLTGTARLGWRPVNALFALDP